MPTFIGRISKLSVLAAGPGSVQLLINGYTANSNVSSVFTGSVQPEVFGAMTVLATAASLTGRDTGIDHVPVPGMDDAVTAMAIPPAYHGEVNPLSSDGLFKGVITAIRVTDSPTPQLLFRAEADGVVADFEVLEASSGKPSPAMAQTFVALTSLVTGALFGRQTVWIQFQVLEGLKGQQPRATWIQLPF